MIQRIIRSYLAFAAALRDIPPLLFRLILAYGFYGPAVQKASNFDSTIKFFASIGIPFPEINAYMATSTEVLGVVLVFLGLATRFIAVPMMVIMVVAIKTVHWQNGFSCASDGDAIPGNGFEIPFYFMIMLFSLIVTGAGKFSLDYLIEKRAARQVQ